MAGGDEDFLGEGAGVEDEVFVGGVVDVDILCGGGVVCFGVGVALVSIWDRYCGWSFYVLGGLDAVGMDTCM